MYERFFDMTTLIAGCGDLGFNVAKRLLAHHEPVIGLRRNPPVSNTDSLEGLTWLAADLRDPATLVSLSNIAQHITQVVYCTTPDQRTPEQYRASYLEGLQNLTAALGTDDLRSVPLGREALFGHNTRRWVFVSSTAVYGASTDEWVDEASPTLPEGFNGKILLEAEQFLSQHHQNSVSMRLSGIYGPGRNQIVQRIKQGLVSAPVEPPHYTNRIHIDDGARAIEHILSLPKPDFVYVVTDQCPLPMHVIYNHIASKLGAPPVPQGPNLAGMASKRLSSQRLVDSGFKHLWPDARQGYDELLKA
jgi:nucleoside-diphosphate-sugar epimerase